MAHNMQMPKVKTFFKSGPPRHFIREWRKHRLLTLERLAERVGVTHGALSQLERGETNYTQPMLEALADALTCTPGDLISRPPEAAPGLRVVEDPRLATLWKQASPEDREQILRVVEALSAKRAVS